MVAVSTDDDSYPQSLRAAPVRKIIVRPAALATDSASLIDVVLHAIEVIACDVVVLVSAATPLICVSDVRRAFAGVVDAHTSALQRQRWTHRRLYVFVSTTASSTRQPTRHLVADNSPMRCIA